MKKDNNIQPLSAKIGEVRFRQKLVKQHRGEKVYYPTHMSARESLCDLKKRNQNTLKIFKELKKNKIALEPFLEVGGEKCNRAAILTSKMGYRGAAMDISGESLESANFFCSKFGFKNLPIRVCADAYHLPFADNLLAFVFTFQTLHHLPDPQPVVKEIYRVLAPGGYFYFGEEPISQVFNLNLWRRDGYHLRWWEKILKAFIILHFISRPGKSEVEEGILEETFTFETWEKALDQFDQVEAELKAFPFGPTASVIKTNKAGWIKPNLFAKTALDILGGGIQGSLCQKKGKLPNLERDILKILICPDCEGKLYRKSGYLKCQSCQRRYPVKNGVLYILPKNLMEKLYP